MSSTTTSWETELRPLTDEDVDRIVSAALRCGGRGGAVLAIVFVDDETLRTMHEELLDDPTPTDVITIDLGVDGVGPVGELYVSVDRAQAVARDRNLPVERELALYLVHGTLHLCGFDDHEPEDRARMRAAEREVLEALGYRPDNRPHDLDADSAV